MERRQLDDGYVLDGRYRILSLSRETDEGFLYEAENILTQKPVRIREYFPQGAVRGDHQNPEIADGRTSESFPALKARFLKAARTMKDFRNLPGVVRVLDYFEANGTVYCVMERTEGVPLTARIEGSSGGHLDPEAAFTGMLPVLKSLGEIHKAGLLYRLIRPDTFEVTEKNAFVICDFGVPKEMPKIQTDSPEPVPDAVQENLRSSLTRLSVFEADAFTPPERMGTESVQGPWSDLYSVTAVLYYCVTGQEPESAYERILGEDLTSPEEFGIHMDAALEEILKKGLEIKAEERYQSADEMIRDIEAVFPEKSAGQQKKGRKRRVLPIVFTAAAVLWLFGIYAYFHPAAFVFHGAETETVWIEPSEDADSKTLAEDWKIIENRVKILTGKQGYVWRKRGEKVLLILPESVFSEKGSRFMIGYYLLDPWNLSIAADDSGKRHDFRFTNAKMESGTMPGLEEYLAYRSRSSGSDREILSSEEENGYLTIKIGSSDRNELEQGLKKFADSIPDANGQDYTEAKALANSRTTWIVKDSNLALKRGNQSTSEMNYEGIDRIVLPIHLNEDSRYIELTGQLRSRPFLRLLAYNLTHTGPKNEFKAVSEQKVKWEDPKKAVTKGTYQKDSSFRITNPVILTYLPTPGSGIGEGDTGIWQKKTGDIKDMLDALQTPYVFGVSKDISREVIIKINRKNIPAFYADVLDSSEHVNLGSGWSRMNQVPYRITGQKVRDGKETIQVQMYEDGSDYRLNHVEEKIKLAQDAGNDEIQLLLGSTAVAAGKIADQKNLSNGIFSFDHLVLPGTKETDTETIVRCLNQLDHKDSDSTDVYELIGTQSLDEHGIPERNQKGLDSGDYHELSEEEYRYAEQLASKQNLRLQCTETPGSHTMFFDNVETVTGSADRSHPEKLTDPAEFASSAMKTAETVFDGILQNTGLEHVCWDKISVELYSSDQTYRVQADLTAKDQIMFDYNLFADSEQNTKITEEREQQFGRLAVHGTIYQKEEGQEAAEQVSVPLEDAADKYPAAAEAKRYLNNSDFFHQYGGTETWEYIVE